MESHIEPTFALSVDIGTPLLVPFEDPLPKPRLVLVEGKIPVLGGFHHGLGAGDGGVWVDEFCGREGGAALLALVTVGVFVAADGAGAYDVAVCEKGLCLFVVVLLALDFLKAAFLVYRAEKFLCQMVVRLARRPGVHVKRNAELLETLLDEVVVTVYHVLRRDTLFFCTQGDGYAVLVTATDEKALGAVHPEVTDVNIRRYVDAGEVTYMDGAVGIRQSRRDEGALEFFLAHKTLFGI